MEMVVSVMSSSPPPTPYTVMYTAGNQGSIEGKYRQTMRMQVGLKQNAS